MNTADIIFDRNCTLSGAAGDSEDVVQILFDRANFASGMFTNMNSTGTRSANMATIGIDNRNVSRADMKINGGAISGLSTAYEKTKG
ncbi:MAG: hypothetical protein ABJ327_17180 [Litoreibacter sp.]